MKVYYYGTPSRELVRWCHGIKKAWRPAKYPLVVLLLMVWAVLIPPAWLAVKLGEIGHRTAGWCGFDSHDW